MPSYMRLALAAAVAAIVCVEASAAVLQPARGGRGDIVAPSRLTGAGASSPALRVTVEQSGLNEVTSTVLPLINQAIGDLELPKQKFDPNVPVLGHVDVELEHIKVKKFNLPQLALTEQSGAQLSASAGGLKLEVKMDWKYDQKGFPYIKDHGSLEVEVSGVDASVSASVSVSGGRPKLDVEKVHADCSNLHIDVHSSGLSGWFINLVIGAFKGKIKDALESGLEGAIHGAVDQSINGMLAKMAISTTAFSGPLEMDIGYPLAGVASTSTYLSALDALSVSGHASGIKCPISNPTALPATTGSDMVQIMMADSFLQCVGYIAYKSGGLDFELPYAQAKGLLNTTAWSGIAPGLTKKCPGCEMDAAVMVATVPAIATKAGVLSAAVSVELNMSVTPATGASRPSSRLRGSPSAAPPVHEHAMTLRVDVDASASLTVKTSGATDALLIPSIKHLSLNLTVKDSAVGPVQVAALNGLFADMLPVILKILNAYLGQGIALPLSGTGMTLENPEVKLGTGYFAIGASFKFTPPKQVGASSELVGSESRQPADSGFAPSHLATRPVQSY